MNVTKEQWMSIAKIVLAGILAICLVFGYDLGVIQPRERAAEQALVAPPGSGAQALRVETRYGVATNVTDGLRIAHTLGTTPTAVLLGETGVYTAGVTAMNAVSFTVAVSVTIPTVYWLVGR